MGNKIGPVGYLWHLSPGKGAKIPKSLQIMCKNDLTKGSELDLQLPNIGKASLKRLRLTWFAPFTCLAIPPKLAKTRHHFYPSALDESWVRFPGYDWVYLVKKQKFVCLNPNLPEQEVFVWRNSQAWHMKRWFLSVWPTWMHTEAGKKWCGCTKSCLKVEFSVFLPLREGAGTPGCFPI